MDLIVIAVGLCVLSLMGCMTFYMATKLKELDRRTFLLGRQLKGVRKQLELAQKACHDFSNEAHGVREKVLELEEVCRIISERMIYLKENFTHYDTKIVGGFDLDQLSAGLLDPDEMG